METFLLPFIIICCFFSVAATEQLLLAYCNWNRHICLELLANKDCLKGWKWPFYMPWNIVLVFLVASSTSFFSCRFTSTTFALSANYTDRKGNNILLGSILIPESYWINLFMRYWQTIFYFSSNKDIIANFMRWMFGSGYHAIITALYWTGRRLHWQTHSVGPNNLKNLARFLRSSF